MAATIQGANRLMSVTPALNSMQQILTGIGQAMSDRQTDNIINGYVPQSNNPHIDLMRLVMNRMFPQTHEQAAPNAAPAMPQGGAPQQGGGGQGGLGQGQSQGGGQPG